MQEEAVSTFEAFLNHLGSLCSIRQTRYYCDVVAKLEAIVDSKAHCPLTRCVAQRVLFPDTMSTHMFGEEEFSLGARYMRDVVCEQYPVAE